MDTNKIDEAVNDYVRESGDGVFTTGWILVASVSSPSHDIGISDGYFTITSDGLPHHTQLGLLKTCLDDKAAQALLASMVSILSGDDE